MVVRDRFGGEFRVAVRDVPVMRLQDDAARLREPLSCL